MVVRNKWTRGMREIVLNRNPVIEYTQNIDTDANAHNHNVIENCAHGNKLHITLSVWGKLYAMVALSLFYQNYIMKDVLPECILRGKEV